MFILIQLLVFCLTEERNLYHYVSYLPNEDEDMDTYMTEILKRNAMIQRYDISTDPLYNPLKSEDTMYISHYQVDIPWDSSDIVYFQEESDNVNI